MLSDFELVDSGKNIKLSKVPPPSEYCDFRGSIQSSYTDRSDRLVDIVWQARRKLRDSSAMAGGNYVKLQTNNISQDGTQTTVNLSGLSYLCRVKHARVSWID